MCCDLLNGHRIVQALICAPGNVQSDYAVSYIECTEFVCGRCSVEGCDDGVDDLRSVNLCRRA